MPDNGKGATVAGGSSHDPPDVLARLADALDATVVLEGHIIDRLKQLEQRVGELADEVRASREG